MDRVLPLDVVKRAFDHVVAQWPRATRFTASGWRPTQARTSSSPADWRDGNAPIDGQAHDQGTPAGRAAVTFETPSKEDVRNALPRLLRWRHALLMRRWFITGVGRGLGREIAAAALARGDRVIGTTRNGTADWARRHEQIEILPLDIVDPVACVASVRQAIDRLGGLDVVVNNAGRVRVGMTEEMNDRDLRTEFDVNFFGAAAIVRAALPAMRQARRGHIVAISSIAAMSPGAATGSYAAAKAALEAFHHALAQEVERFGIHVMIVAPRALRTGFLSPEAAVPPPPAITDYEEFRDRLTVRLRAIDGCQSGDPTRAAAAILQALEASRPPRLLALGSDAVRMARARLHETQAALADWETVAQGIDATSPFPV